MSTNETAGPSGDTAAMIRRGTPGASYSLIIRLKLSKSPGGTLGKVTSVIGELGGDIGPIHIVGSEKDAVTRDITVNLSSAEHGEAVVARLKELPDVTVVNVSDRTFLIHLGGKIRIETKTPLVTADDLAMAYTPGVGRVCQAIHSDPAKVHTLTIKRNTIAIVTDGTRVLGLGDIGPEAALPVMEGKAALYKSFADVDAFPICLATRDTEEIIRTVKAIAPVFGGIHLEDIESPKCFEIERRLAEELDVPVFHDDQHGTAIVVLAATLNALKVVKKQLRNIRLVAVGTGAAGMACIKLLMAAGLRNIIPFNRGGALHRGRTDLTPEERWLAERTNSKGFTGPIAEALKGADMFLGLSAPGVIQAKELAAMKKDAIVFALANPVPEVLPEEAAPYVRVMATGGSHYPNQVNNALVFPGFFRGLLDCRARRATEQMKLKAARALAAVVSRDELFEEYIIPSVFNPKVASAIADAVVKVAGLTGEARRCRKA